MKPALKNYFPLAILFCFFLSACQPTSRNINLPFERRIKFNSDWEFRLAQSPNDSIDNPNADWTPVKLPHDWSIEGKISLKNPSGRHGGWYPTGIGFYRKRFQLSPQWEGKLGAITFDGIMSNSKVWINGILLGQRPNGYVEIYYNLTPYLRPGMNEIRVLADNSLQPNSRWYTGSGIYRNTWLTIRNKISVANHGTYVYASNISDKRATVHFEVTLENHETTEQDIVIENEIITPVQKKIVTISKVLLIPSRQSYTLRADTSITNPQLWSPETPNCYLLRTKIKRNGELLDCYETPFGIREIKFDSETGFWLNGKNIKIKGVNNHHDAGPVGAAVPNDVLHRRLKLLKEFGFNAIRTSHNPFAPEFYNMCDTMGFLVMDEVFDEWIASWPWANENNQGKIDYGYHLYFNEWWQKDLSEVILRDRNHPSVFMWSVGNEIPDQCYPEGPRRLKPMLDLVHSLDRTRPVTCGCCYIHLANQTGFASLLDVTGYNGGGGSVFYEKDKTTYPNRKFIATEIPHTFQTRGVYKTLTEMRAPEQGIPVPNLTEEEVFPEFSKFYSSSYDNSSVRLSARDSWRRTDSLAYVAGEFRWTGFDYLGEAIKGWPSRFWNFGIFDLCGFPKDHAYYYKSQFTNDPMIHLLPHWTWPGKEGKIIPVWTYSNAEETELFLNGKSLGKKSILKYANCAWQVPYQPGKLLAVAYSGGQIVARDSAITAGRAAQIQLIADKNTIKADDESCVHVEVNILDERGNFVPNANYAISFTINGPVRNLGVENGDPLDLTPSKTNHKKTFHGKCLLILQSTHNSGTIEITAKAEGLYPKTIRIRATP